MYWCKYCRIWYDYDHTSCNVQPKHIRYHPGWPKCGDVWRLKNGTHIVVDYIDSFSIGVTEQNGNEYGFGYTDSFSHLVEGGKLLSTFEEFPLPKCDKNGWSSPNCISNAEAVQFINDTISRLENECVAPSEAADKFELFYAGFTGFPL